MIKITTIQHEKEWLEASLGLPSSFAQAWDWGQILKKEGKKVERLVAWKDEKSVAIAQVIYVSIGLGFKYAFCPKGPLGEMNDEVLGAFQDYFKAKKVLFWRIEPVQPIENQDMVKSRDINPMATMILDLQKNEEDILAGMHSKTRYNINLSQKKNLELKNEKNLSVFWGLMKKTGARDGFRLHEAGHYQAILDSDFSTQLSVYSHGKAIATMVLVGYGDTFTYLFGASDHDYRAMMAPYMLQWSAMTLGKDKGYKFYDFFGVAPNISDNENYEYSNEHQYGGVSRFKSGFGARYTEFPGTFDFIINKLGYNLYLRLRKLRRLV